MRSCRLEWSSSGLLLTIITHFGSFDNWGMLMMQLDLIGTLAFQCCDVGNCFFFYI